jgi:hypothetical protein
VSACCHRLIELGHQLAVRSPRGCEFIAAFFELQAKVGGLLFEVGDFLVERIDVGGCAEPGFAPCLFAERVRQPQFEVADAAVEPDGAFVGGEQVGLQGGAGDGGSRGVAGGRRGGFGGVDLLEKVTMPVEKGPVDAGGPGDARRADLGPAGGLCASSRCARRGRFLLVAGGWS